MSKELILISCVFVGGGFGSALRYVCMRVYQVIAPSSTLPLNTLFVNILGGFLLGILFAYVSEQINYRSSYLWNAVAVGLLGGLTTFSTFSLEVVNMLTNRLFFLAINYAIANLTLSCLGLVLGYLLLNYLQTN